MGLITSDESHGNAGSFPPPWLDDFAPAIHQLKLEWYALGSTYDALEKAGALHGRANVRRCPNALWGGLIDMLAQIVGHHRADELHGIVCLITPGDTLSIFPEVLALKRQCLIQGKPFLSTMAALSDWLETERIMQGMAPDTALDALHGNIDRTVVLIAHDGMKSSMTSFVDAHFNLLSRAARRVSTGTTGRQLNRLAIERGSTSNRSWVTCYESGPLGGDAQIAELVIARQCQRVIFFIDPRVTHEHEADIQVLERAVMTATDDALCMTSPAMAARWAEAATRRASPP